ncbi:MAG TPA: hypothetical protein VJQ09_01645, partial [Candidatus Limnocylindria bacterium]|nr:hypothetical protein [Candidatus Limnocylindria bacterium]
LAIASVAIVGLQASQSRILVFARERRAGEAAAEAAAAVAADAYANELRRVARSTASPRPMPRVGEAVASAHDAALAAASDISVRNDGAPIDDVVLLCDHSAVEATVVIGRITYRAGFGASQCSPR